MVRFYLSVCWVFLVLIAGHTAVAQGVPGYVLTTSGDTLKGFVVEKLDERVVVLYAQPNSPPQQFSAAQARGYGLRGMGLVRSATVRRAAGPSEQHFVAAKSLGPASLYTFSDESGLLLQPPAPAADTLYELTADNWHILLNRFLRGCPTLDPSSLSVLQLRFTEPNLWQLVARYNTCINPDWKTASRTKPTLWLPGVGLRLNYASTTTKGKDTSHPQTGHSRAAGVELAWVRASGLQMGLGLGHLRVRQQTQFYRGWQVPGQPVAYEWQDVVTAQLLTAEGSVGQRLGRPRRLNFYLGIGGNVSYRLQSTTETRQRLTGSTQYSQFVTQNGSGGPLFSLNARFGTIIPTFARQEVRLAAFYQYYVFTDINSVGVELLYTIFRR